MIHYEAISLISLDVRYMLLNNRLTLSASITDPFGWNITKSRVHYCSCQLLTRNDIHSHAVTLRIAWAFGGNKVNNVYRDSKERESSRAN